MQYDYYPGYEPIGISITAHGKFDNDFGGGVLLYKNIYPVKCTCDENGYTSFEIPLEVEIVRTLK